MIFDVIIIGGGAAGLSTALWCDELGLSALLLEAESELGGQLLRVHNAIKNHLGAKAENGRELRDIFLQQIEGRKFTIRVEAKVRKIDFEKKAVLLASGEEFSAKTLVIATGVRRRKLGIEGEEEFREKGILESGKLNQNSARGKRVVVVGGGDAAFENALILAEAARKVTLIHRRENFRARKEFIERAENNPKIEILRETILTKIIGAQWVEAAETKNLRAKRKKILRADVVLIRIGVEPNAEILRGKLSLDKENYVETDAFCETSVENVFAAGDIANPVSPTVSTAVGTGAAAAKIIRTRILPEKYISTKF